MSYIQIQIKSVLKIKMPIYYKYVWKPYLHFLSQAHSFLFGWKCTSFNRQPVLRNDLFFSQCFLQNNCSRFWTKVAFLYYMDKFQSSSKYSDIIMTIFVLGKLYVWLEMASLFVLLPHQTNSNNIWLLNWYLFLSGRGKEFKGKTETFTSWLVMLTFYHHCKTLLICQNP